MLRDDGLWETVRFQLLLPVHGTLCRLSSLAAFRHQLKTVLFRTFFGEDEPRHCQHVTVLVFVRWPCTVCM